VGVLEGLVESLKAVVSVHVETLKAIVDLYVKFLGVG